MFLAKIEKTIINPNGKNSADTVLIHELDHAIRSYIDKDGNLKTVFNKEALKNLDKETADKIENAYGKDMSEDTRKDEQNAHFAEYLTNKNTLKHLVSEKPSLKQRILSFFKKASTDYAEYPSLEGAAKKYYRTYKKLFDQFSERNAQSNASESQASAVAVKKKRKSSADFDKTKKTTVSSMNTENMHDTERYTLKPYSEKQKENWKNSKSIVIYESPEQLRTFVKLSRNNGQYNKKIYFGAISTELAQRIYEGTGLNLENYNVALYANEIRKIFKDHGNEETEHLRGQRAITESDFAQIPDVMQNATEIYRSETDYEGKPAIVFVKADENSRTTIVAVVSDKHLDLRVQTEYIHPQNKKGTLATPLGEQAPNNTPKASSGTDSTNIIPLPTDSVNPSEQNNSKTKLSLPLDITISDVDALRAIGKKSINDFTDENIQASEAWAKKFYKELGTKSPFFRRWFGDWRAYDTTEIDYVPVNTNFVENGSIPRGEFYNDDTKWDISVKSNGVDKTKNQMGVGSKEHRSLIDLENMIDHAILLDTVVADNPSKKMGSSAVFVHHLYCPINMNGNKGIAKIYVSEHIEGEHKFYLTKIEEVSRAIGKNTNEGADVHRAKSTAGETSSTVSIAKLFEFVKKHDKNFEKDSKKPVYFNPKPVNPILLNEDGTPKVFYHGTSQRFTEFRPEEMSSQEGSYFFAENKEDAQAYGDYVMSVYLTGEKLANYDDQPYEFYRLRNKRKQVEWLKERGYDGWYADMDSGGWGELSVFSPTQVKSATDNIGTFSGSKDIRYSLPLDESTRQDRQERIAKLEEKLYGTITKERNVLYDENSGKYIGKQGQSFILVDDAASAIMDQYVIERAMNSKKYLAKQGIYPNVRREKVKSVRQYSDYQRLEMQREIDAMKEGYSSYYAKETYLERQQKERELSELEGSYWVKAARKDLPAFSDMGNEIYYHTTSAIELFARTAKALGAVEVHHSAKKGSKFSSSIYLKLGDTELRVSDHFLPDTAEREDRGGFRWDDEIVFRKYPAGDTYELVKIKTKDEMEAWVKSKFGIDDTSTKLGSTTKYSLPLDGDAQNEFVSETIGSIRTKVDENYKAPLKDKVFSGWTASQIAFTNAQAGIESIGKKLGIKDIETLVQTVRAANSQADEMIAGNQYRIGAEDKVYQGEGLAKIFDPISKKGEDVKREFFDYLFNYHNIDRMSLEERSVKENDSRKSKLKKIVETPDATFNIGRANMTVGQLTKVIANNTRTKVYSKKDVLEVMKQFCYFYSVAAIKSPSRASCRRFKRSGFLPPTTLPSISQTARHMDPAEVTMISSASSISSIINGLSSTVMPNRRHFSIKCPR